MADDLEVKKDLEEDRGKKDTKTSVRMQRARVNDYLAIALALGTVFLLWLLQWMGLY